MEIQDKINSAKDRSSLVIKTKSKKLSRTFHQIRKASEVELCDPHYQGCHYNQCTQRQLVLVYTDFGKYIDKPLKVRPLNGRVPNI